MLAFGVVGGRQLIWLVAQSNKDAQNLIPANKGQGSRKSNNNGLC